jgi:hypothetical protein
MARVQPARGGGMLQVRRMAFLQDSATFRTPCEGYIKTDNCILPQVGTDLGTMQPFKVLQRPSCIGAAGNIPKEETRCVFH